MRPKKPRRLKRNRSSQSEDELGRTGERPNARQKHQRTRRQQQDKKDINICKNYTSFGDCPFGAYCVNEHRCEVVCQEFIPCVIAKVHKRDERIEVKPLPSTKPDDKEVFCIPTGKWFNGEAKLHKIALIQASENKRGKRHPRRLGRILNTLDDNGHQQLWKNFPVSASSATTTVYTLDTPGTKLFDNAYSVDEKCPKHLNCSIIGIHIACASLCNPFKVAPSAIPSHSQKYRSCQSFNLREGHRALALSLHVHTRANEDIKLQVIWVKVKKNCFLDEKIDNFDILWKHFIDEKEMVKDRSLQKYMIRFPEYWKACYLVDKMMSFYNEQVKSYFQSEKSKGIIFITKVWERNLTIEEGKEVAVYEDVWRNRHPEVKDKAHSPDQLPEVVINKALVSGVRLIDLREVPTLLPKYRWTAETLATSGENSNIVQYTSPIRKIHHFVNQQIIIQHLIKFDHSGSEIAMSNCYTERELLGILVTRHESPQLVKAIVTKVGRDAFSLEYIGLLNVTESIYEAPYSLFKSCQSSSSAGKFEILIKGTHRGEAKYCNRNLVHTTLRNLSENDAETTPLVEESPYVENDGNTKLTIQAGIELQIQVSVGDARRNHPLKWRLLKIADDHHMCFTHQNNPELAFMSERKDVRDIVTDNRIKMLLAYQAHGVINRGIQIDWHDDYYSGGRFLIESSQEIGERSSFLCIRRDEGNYIWCCHAVMTEVTKESSGNCIVEFEVCSLSQTQTVSENGNFIVEILSHGGESKTNDETQRPPVCD